jgi:hypothetical protein
MGGNHRRVNLETAGQLRGGLLVGQRGQGNLSLELGTVLLAFLAHL